MSRHTLAVTLIVLSTTALVRADGVEFVDAVPAEAVPATLVDLAAVSDLDAAVETRSVDQCAALPGSTDMALMGLGVVGMIFRRLRP